MKYLITKKTMLNANNVSITVHAPLVANRASAGQFVIIRPFCDSERIPLTISDYDSKLGLVTLIFAPVGETTKELASLNEGEFVCDICGPLGRATDTKTAKNVIVIGGGVGSAIALPVAKQFKEDGARVTAILGFRESGLVILSEQFKSVCDELIITTNDGSMGEKGFVNAPLERLLSNGGYDEVIAIGSLLMMKKVCESTKPFGVKTIVSMNPIMIDGTGICGGCRLLVDGKIKFACVDGPEFDGHLVDFDSLMRSNAQYSVHEKEHSENCNLFKGVL